MKRVLILTIIMLTIMGIAYGVGRKASEHTPDMEFDIDRYMGTWYEVARYDHSFERNMEQVTATCQRISDKRIRVVNRGYNTRTRKWSEAVGKAKPGDRAGQLRVSFFWIFYSDYNILELAEDYSWALVGSSSPHYLWILSRTPSLPAKVLDEILATARSYGYDTEKLIFVAQD